LPGPAKPRLPGESHWNVVFGRLARGLRRHVFAAVDFLAVLIDVANPEKVSAGEGACGRLNIPPDGIDIPQRGAQIGPRSEGPIENFVAAAKIVDLRRKHIRR